MKKFFVPIKNYWWLIGSFVLGLDSAVGIFNYPVNPQDSPGQSVFFVLALGLAFALVVFFMGKVFFSTIGHSLKRLWGWIFFSVLAGVMLVWAIPLEPASVVPKHHVLEITATGKKSVQSKSSEVWVYSVRTGDGKEMVAEPSDVPRSGWEYRSEGGDFVSYKFQPATLKYTIPGNRVHLELGSQAWSGEVRIRWNRQEQTIDLFAENPGVRKVDLSVRDFFSNREVSALLYLPDVIWISFLLLFAGAWLVAHPPQMVRPSVLSRWTLIVYALPMIAAWAIYLLAYWPGGMSPDSLDQWGQLLRFQFTDWHPVFHTLTNWLITRLWLSPAAVVLTQIVILSLVLGWGLVVLRRAGSPGWLTWLTVLLFMALPSIGFMVIMLWKDVFYSIAATALTIMVLEIVLSGGKWIERRLAWIYLGVVVTCIALYRQNGMITAFGTLLVLIFAWRDLWKPLVKALLLAVFLWAGVRGPLYSALAVNRDIPSGLGMALSHLIARYTNTDVYFSREEHSLLAKIRPESRWPYDCYMESALYFDGNYNYESEKRLTDSLALLTAKLIYREPDVFLDHLGCNGSFAYQVTQPRNTGYETVVPYIFPNALGLKTESKLPQVKRALDSWDGQTPNPMNWLIWRVPFWHYLLLAGVVFYWLRTGNWKSLLIMAPIALNVIPLVLLTGGQAFRYVFSSTLISLLMGLPFLLGYLPALDSVSRVITGHQPINQALY